MVQTWIKRETLNIVHFVIQMADYYVMSFGVKKSQIWDSKSKIFKKLKVQRVEAVLGFPRQLVFMEKYY